MRQLRVPSLRSKAVPLSLRFFSEDEKREVFFHGKEKDEEKRKNEKVKRKRRKGTGEEGRGRERKSGQYSGTGSGWQALVHEDRRKYSGLCIVW